MRQIISFDRLKLTNNEMDDKGHVSVQQSFVVGGEGYANSSAFSSLWRGLGDFYQVVLRNCLSPGIVTRVTLVTFV